MNRRDFLRLRRRTEAIREISGEELFMRYVDSRMEGSEDRFLRRVRQLLSPSNPVRLREPAWLENSELQKELPGVRGKDRPSDSEEPSSD